MTSTTFVTVPCQVCQAPVRPGHEHTTHEASCLQILLGCPPSLFQQVFDPTALQNYCYRTHCEDQARTHLRETTPPVNDNINGLKDLVKDNPHDGRWTSWQERLHGQTFPVPEGKVLCAYCNGITHMYPDCGNCGGKGWVD